MTAAVPGFNNQIPGIGDISSWLGDAITPSVDAQVWVSPNNGSSFGTTWFQADDFPNFAVYRYIACSGQSQKAVDVRHARTATAFWGMIDRTSWSYNQYYGSASRTWGNDYWRYL